MTDDERDALNRGGVRGVIESRAEWTDGRLAALESHVTPIPRMEGEIEKLQKEVAGIQGSLPMIEEDVENLENAVRQADRRIAALEKVVMLRITTEMVQQALSKGRREWG